MKSKTKALKEDAGRVDLNINHDNAKIMSIGAEPTHFTLNRTPVENTFVCLDIQIFLPPDDGLRENVKHRIRKAQEAFSQLRA